MEVNLQLEQKMEQRAAFKSQIARHVGGLMEPIRKTKFASTEDYKYVLRKVNFFLSL